MRITYSKNDPRAGMTVEMDEARARELIESGAATKATGAEAKASEAATAVTTEAPQPAARRVSKSTAKKGR